MKTHRNILARRIRGIDPPSWRRRMTYGVRAWMPLFVFAGLLIGLMRLLGGFDASSLTFAVVLAPGFMGIGTIALRIGLVRDIERYRSNWQEYKLAGIPGRDILWASAQPSFSSGMMIAAISLAITILLHVFVFGFMIEPRIYSTMFGFILDAGFMLTGGVLLDTALWSSERGALARIVSFVTLLILSPGILLAIAVTVMVVSNPGPEYQATIEKAMMLLPVAIAGTMAIKMWRVRRAWKQAAQRLEGQPIRRAIVPMPMNPGASTTAKVSELASNPPRRRISPISKPAKTKSGIQARTPYVIRRRQEGGSMPRILRARILR